MSARKAFLAALGAAGVALAAKDRADAQSIAPPNPTPPGPAATQAAAKPATKFASPAAVAVAATMLRFDPALTAAELDKIAHSIDDNGKAARALVPKDRPLHNWDEPVLIFDPSPR